MPTALRPNASPWSSNGWRAVEAQHKNATLSLVHGNLTAQALLEEIIEEVKPVLPPEAKGLYWLMSTPFRYPPPPSGSRFRRPWDPGVFYGAEDTRTACAEAGYWRLRFWMDSHGLSIKTVSIQMTLFQFEAVAAAMIDLTAPPFKRQRKKWIDSQNYTATQAVAVMARAEGIDMIRYESARNGPDGRCLAMLTPTVFKKSNKAHHPIQESWSVLIEPPNLTVWQRSINNDSFSFRY
jgi:hypothetical protein